MRKKKRRKVGDLGDEGSIAMVSPLEVRVLYTSKF